MASINRAAASAAAFLLTQVNHWPDCVSGGRMATIIRKISLHIFLKQWNAAGKLFIFALRLQ
jgi:hypothetical protein